VHIYMHFLSILLLFARIDKNLIWTDTKQKYPSDDKFIKLFFPTPFFFVHILLSIQKDIFDCKEKHKKCNMRKILRIFKFVN